MSDDFRYDLWYAQDFPLADLHYAGREEKDRELRGFVDTIEQHIRRFGLLYPIGIYIRPTGIDVRPGKCRVTALQRMGRTTCPAIVCDYTKWQRPNWTRLPHDADFIQAQFFKGSDSIVELSRRFFSIKKLDTVRRPGVEDQFTRELRVVAETVQAPT